MKSNNIIGRVQITPADREAQGIDGAFAEAVNRARTAYLDLVRAKHGAHATVELRILVHRPA